MTRACPVTRSAGGQISRAIHRRALGDESAAPNRAAGRLSNPNRRLYLMPLDRFDFLELKAALSGCAASRMETRRKISPAQLSPIGFPHARSESSDKSFITYTGRTPGSFFTSRIIPGNKHCGCAGDFAEVIGRRKFIVTVAPDRNQTLLLIQSTSLEPRNAGER